jgi:tryptophan-rich sensory protein
MLLGMRKGMWTALAGFVGAVATVAVVGGLITRRNLGWHRRLRKPSWNPPQSAFPAVWTGLYALMVASAYRVWRQPDSPERTRALRLWAAQLAANGAWTPLFFGAHKPKWALADSALLLAGIAAYATTASRVDKPAAWLMAPYGAWTTFATALNGEIVRRNPRN